MKAQTRYERRLLKQFRRNRSTKARLYLALAATGLILVLHWATPDRPTGPLGPPVTSSTTDADRFDTSAGDSRYSGPTAELEACQQRQLAGLACSRDQRASVLDGGAS